MAVAWSKSETKSHSLTPTYTITQQSTSPSVLCTSYMCPMSMWAATTPNNYSSPYVFLTQHSSPPPPPPPVQKGLVELAREDDAQQYLIVSDNPSRISSSRSVGQSDCLYTHPYMSLEDPRRTMEGRARRCASPAGMRTKAVRVEPEPPPPTTTRRHEPGTRVAVVYYLTRNHHLEHPHFMEVPLASPQGLYLRDVIGRLDALRGKGMAAKYSWSCKRSYKTGFVWHDLSADDLLLPTQGTEFVLKGSELPFDQSKPLPLLDHQQNNATCADNAKDRLPCKPARQQESPPSPGSSNQGWTSKSPSPTPATYPAVPVMKEAVPPSPPPPPTRAAVVPAMKEVVVPPPIPQPVSPSTPTASIIGDEEQCRIPPHSGSSSNSSPKTTSMASSSGTSSPSPTKPAAAGSDAATQTDDKARWDDGKLQHRQDTARASSSPERPEIVVDEESRCTLAPAGENHRRSRRSGTLQSLIRAEAAGRRRALPLPEEDDRAAAAPAATGGSVSGRLKPANLLMRLMACGPNHPGFGLVQSSSPYRPPRFAQLEYPSSPELSPLCALKPGTTGASTVRASETENSSGRLLDGALKLSSSSSRSHHEGVVCKEEAWPEGVNNNLSRSVSKRTSDPSSGRMASSSKVVSFRDE